MNPMNIFVGVPQSKYAGVAILIALIIVAFAMLFGKEQVPVGQKFLFVLIMFVVALPSVLFTLFQLTCLVTGAGAKNQRWWCTAYAWIGAIFIIMYSVIIVVVGITSLVNGSNVLYDVNQAITVEQMQLANSQAAEYFQNVDIPKKENPLAQSMQKGPGDMAPFTVGPNINHFANGPSMTATPHMEPPSQKQNQNDGVAHFTVVKNSHEGFESGSQIPPYVPEETEAQKSAKKMAAGSGVAPQPVTPHGVENFADFSLTEQEHQEMFQNRRR